LGDKQLTGEDRRILVTGATGTVGRHLIEDLIRRGAPVRALIHDHRKRADLESSGVQVALASFEDRDSLERALAGVERLFLLTPPGTDLMVRRQAAVIDAAARVGARHVVKQSSIAADEPTATGILRAHGEIEDLIEASGLEWTHLRPNWLMQNALGQAGSIATDGTLRAPDVGRITTVDARDIAAVAARVLTEPGHEGRAYLATGPEAISYAEIAEVYSAELGRPVQWVEETLDEARGTMEAFGLSPELARDTVAILARLREGGAGTRVSPDVAEVLGREPRSFRQFVRDHRSVLDGA
jgi:uncharacterized protein YbjT (DUF2867 family)